MLAGVVLLSFGVGFLAGHYHTGLGHHDQTDATVADAGSARTASGSMVAGAFQPRVGATPPVSIPVTVPVTTSHPGDSPPRSRLSEQIPPHPLSLLTPQDRADLAAQHTEVRMANIKQLEAMIQSLELSGGPDDQIAHFQAMLKNFESQGNDDDALLESEPPERTEEELRYDLAASLEQAGMPHTEIEQMLEAFANDPMTHDDDTGDWDMEPVSAQGAEP